MDRIIINVMPFWLCVLCLILGLFCFTLLLDLLIRRYFPNFLMKNTPYTGSHIQGLYGLVTILLAFTIVVLWQYFQNTQNQIDAEAAAISQIVYYAHGFSDKKTSRKIITLADNYVQITKNKEWPLMRNGQTSPEASAALTALYYAIEAYLPQTPKDSVLYQKIFDQVNTALISRDARIDAVESAMPPFLHLAIFISVLILFIVVAFTNESKIAARIVVYGAMSFAFGLLLGLLIELDYPYAGEFSVSHQKFQLYNQRNILTQ